MENDGSGALTARYPILELHWLLLCGMFIARSRSTRYRHLSTLETVYCQSKTDSTYSNYTRRI